MLAPGVGSEVPDSVVWVPRLWARRLWARRLWARMSWAPKWLARCRVESLDTAIGQPLGNDAGSQATTATESLGAVVADACVYQTFQR